jgi:hypothetical protein
MGQEVSRFVTDIISRVHDCDMPWDRPRHAYVR